MRGVIRLRVMAFAVIGALAVIHVGARYAGLESLFRDTSYSVSVRLADSGGIFERKHGRLAELVRLQGQPQRTKEEIRVCHCPERLDCACERVT